MHQIGRHIVQWIRSVTGQDVAHSTPLVGGTSSHVYACELSDGSRVVLRHVTDRSWLRAEPDLIRNEARALSVLSDSQVLAPSLLASKPMAGLLLMTHLPGVMRSTRTEVEGDVNDICDAAVNIASTKLPPNHGLPEWKSWAPQPLRPPAWGDQMLWSRAIEIYQRENQPSTEAPRLIHRDLHPLNLLWSSNGTAVVDWVNACVGHPHAELGHTRWNIAVLGSQAAAEQFLERYLAQTKPASPADATDYDPWWDLAPLLSFTAGSVRLDGWHAVGRSELSLPDVVVATERFLRSALLRY